MLPILIVWYVSGADNKISRIRAGHRGELARHHVACRRCTGDLRRVNRIEPARRRNVHQHGVLVPAVLSRPGEPADQSVPAQPPCAGQHDDAAAIAHADIEQLVGAEVQVTAVVIAAPRGHVVAIRATTVSVDPAGTAAAGRTATRIDGPAGPGAAAATSEVDNTRAATAANDSNQRRMDPPHDECLTTSDTFWRTTGQLETLAAHSSTRAPRKRGGPALHVACAPREGYARRVYVAR